MLTNDKTGFESVVWNPPPQLLRVERRAGDRRVLAAWHPAVPFAATLGDDVGRAGVVAIRSMAVRFALEYLRRLEGEPVWLGLGALALQGLARAPVVEKGQHDLGVGVELRWFAFDEPEATLPGSFTVSRYGRDDNEIDATHVLCAGLVRFPDQNEQGRPFRLLDGQGLRVVVHGGSNGDGQRLLRITGMAHSLPVLDAEYLKLFSELPGLFPAAPADVDAPLRGPASSQGRPSFKSNTWPSSGSLVDAVMRASGLDPDSQEAAEYGLGITRSRAGTSRSVVVKTRSTRRGHGYRITVDIGDDGSLRQLHLASLTAHAQALVNAGLFWRDPASQRGPDEWAESRPSLQSAQLEKFCEDGPLYGLSAPMESGPGRETVRLEHRHFRVCDCGAEGEASTAEIARDDTGGSAIVYPPALGCDTSVRSDAFSAVSAYARGGSLFELLEACGFRADEYFRYVPAIVNLHYRGTLSYGNGRSGEVVNAEAQLSPGTPGNPASISVHFALADVSSIPSISPLGIVCDPRWSWHEFGHVVLAAATGELELPFVHSVGDSLAAILCDPDSELARHAGWRGQTFPWVLTRRRHDRRADEGWGWGGEMDRPERTYFSSPDRGRSQYWVEQILSSTLFRLYRALGGDAIDANGDIDREARRDAARYTAYLILRAVKLLGPCSVVPAASASHFAAALMDADAGTGAFEQSLTTRAGGAAIKAIRWAFARQGLVETGAQPDAGLVDLRIDDRLSRLPDDPTGVEDGDPGPWLEVSSSRTDRGVVAVTRPEGATTGAPWQVWVRVVNRGTAEATGVKVSVSAARIGDAVPPGCVPAWGNRAWEHLSTPDTATARAACLEPGASRWYGPFSWTPPGHDEYALIAWVSCPQDRATLDPEAGFPCSSERSDVRWFASLDDNVALCRARIGSD